MPALLLVLTTWAGTGCATRAYEPRPIDAAALQSAWAGASIDDEATRRALADGGIDTRAWPLPAWDAAALTALALARHPDMAVARAELREAEAVQASALQRAGRDAEVTAERHSDDAGRSPWSLGVVVDGLMTGADQRTARAAEARALADEAVHRAAQTAWAVRRQVREAHRTLHFAGQAARLAQQSLQQRGALATAARSRLARGAIDASEALRAHLAESDARQQAAQAIDAERRARSALAAAAALPVARIDAMTLRFDEFAAEGPTPMPGEALQREALLNRLDVRAALARYAAADAALRLELARQWPDLVLRPGYAWDQGDRVWSLGLAVRWPPGGRNQAAIDTAQARREAEAARFAVVQTAALAALELAVQEAEAARALRDGARDRWAEAQQAAQRAERRLAAGDADRPEAVSAALAATEAQRQWLDAQAALWAARDALEDAVQRPLDRTSAAKSSAPGDARLGPTTAVVRSGAMADAALTAATAAAVRSTPDPTTPAPPSRGASQALMTARPAAATP